MFQRFHESKDEGGFTLIELLVVVLIIAILAAIAVPVFLNQRKKAWVSQVESGLKDAATAEESFRTEGTASAYTSNWTALESQGFNYSSQEIKLEPFTAGKDGYCLKISSLNDTDIKGVYSSEDGAPKVVQTGTATGSAYPEGAGTTACTL